MRQRRNMGGVLGVALLLAASMGVAGCSDDDDNTCDGVAGACSEVDATNCDGNLAQQCQRNTDGCLVWTTVETCGTGYTCNAGACECDDACSDGESQCSGDTIQNCEQNADSCWVWADETDCSATSQSCDDNNGSPQCVTGAGCGNDLIEAPEVCDGTNLNSRTCADEGFTDGNLGCANDCLSFDTSNCTTDTCGDDVIDGDDVCDGSDLDGRTCADEGFVAGDLGCLGNCSDYDTTNCTMCGNNLINGSEVCDGTEVGARTCLDEGFNSGTLVCNSTCDDYDITNCVNLVEICNNRIDDDSNGDTDCADASCVADSTCELGYNLDFNDWTVTDPPIRYDYSATSEVSCTQSATEFGTAPTSLRCHWTTTNSRDLIYEMSFPVTVGTEYTVHTWVYDDDPYGRVRPGIQFEGGSSAWQNDYSEDLSYWQEVTNTATADSATMIIRMRMYDVASSGFDPAVGATIFTDDWAVTEHHPYVTDATLDTDTVEVLTDTGAGTFLNAGYNDEGVFYVATQAGASTSDRVVYIWTNGVSSSSTVASPWNKAGVVPAPLGSSVLLAMIDEGSSDFCGWYVYDAGSSTWAQIPSGVSCFDSYHVATNLFTGTIAAAAIFGLSPNEVTGRLYVSVVEYGTNDGDGVLSQMPAAVTADNDITGGETQLVNRANILSGKIYP